VGPWELLSVGLMGLAVLTLICPIQTDRHSCHLNGIGMYLERNRDKLFYNIVKNNDNDVYLTIPEYVPCIWVELFILLFLNIFLVSGFSCIILLFLNMFLVSG